MSALLDMNEANLIGYAGDVSPSQAFAVLSQHPAAQLIDVRSLPEWNFSGAPNLAAIGKEAQFISWKIYPTMEVNPAFTSQVEAAIPNKDAPLYFICKTGGRSLDAAVAMTQAGYSQCYNIAGGFEGDRDEHGHRGSRNGWKAELLPWEQA